MKPNPTRPLPRPRTGAALTVLGLLLALLQGCASTPTTSTPEESATDAATPATTAESGKARARTPITPKLQAELDAALALLRSEQYEQSVEAFKKLTLAMPDNALPPTNLALAYAKLGKLDQAEDRLKEALAREADNPVAANELALLYRRMGRFADARAIYEKLLAKYQNFHIARKNLAVLCDLYLRDYACALTHYKIYAENTPQDKSVAIWIADLQKRSGK